MKRIFDPDAYAEHMDKLMDRIFKEMEGEDNAAFLGVGFALLMVAIDAAPTAFRSEAGQRVREMLESYLEHRHVVH